MVQEIRSAPLLAGFRGEAPADRKALVDLLLTVSEVVEAYPEIQEMDLNPVIAHADESFTELLGSLDAKATELRA